MPGKRRRWRRKPLPALRPTARQRAAARSGRALDREAAGPVQRGATLSFQTKTNAHAAAARGAGSSGPEIRPTAVLPGRHTRLTPGAVPRGQRARAGTAGGSARAGRARRPPPLSVVTPGRQGAPFARARDGRRGSGALRTGETTSAVERPTERWRGEVRAAVGGKQEAAMNGRQSLQLPSATTTTTTLPDCTMSYAIISPVVGRFFWARSRSGIHVAPLPAAAMGRA